MPLGYGTAALRAVAPFFADFTRPLEFDSALYLFLFLLESWDFAAFRTLSSSWFSLRAWVRASIFLLTSEIESSRRLVLRRFSWVWLLRATDRDMRLYVSLRLFVSTPVLHDAWISAATWLSNFRALANQTLVKAKKEEKKTPNKYTNVTIASTSECLIPVCWLVQWCWDSPRFVVDWVIAQSSGVIFERHWIMDGKIHLLLILCAQQSTVFA